MKDSFKARTTLACGNNNFEIFSLAALKGRNVARLPYSLKILLENLLRFEDGVNVTRDDIEALLNWDPKAAPAYEISFTPSRVIMQDFTGVPAIVDLAAMREAMIKLGGNPDEINPLSPAELVIDHSVQVDAYGTRALAGQEHRDRVQPQHRALRVPALGPDRVPQLQGRAAEHRHRAPGEHRAPGARRVRHGEGRRALGVSRHAGRHRLAHHDGQRPGRAGLGRRRHRSGSRDARPARHDADSARHRLQAHRQPARRHDRHGPRAHRHRDAAQEGRGRQVRRVLRRRPRQPAARRPRDDRQHVAGVRQHLRASSRSTKRRCAISSSPAAPPITSRW